MRGFPHPIGSGAASECLISRPYLAGALVDQVESTFDMIEPPADIIRPDMHAGKIHLHPGESALESTEARDDLVQLPAGPSCVARIARSKLRLRSARSSLIGLRLGMLG